MARRKQAAPPPLRSASLESLAPLKLSRAEVAALGPVRAAADAVMAHPTYRASLTAARAHRDDHEAVAAHGHAAAALIRRTAYLAAQNTAPF